MIGEIYDQYRHHPYRCARCGGVRRSTKPDYQPHCDWCAAALARQAAKAGAVYVQGALL